MRNSVSIIRNYAVEVIDERMLKREKRDATKPSKGDRDLLDLFMDHGIGREELVDTVLNFIIGEQGFGPCTLSSCQSDVHQC